MSSHLCTEHVMEMSADNMTSARGWDESTSTSAPTGLPLLVRAVVDLELTGVTAADDQQHGRQNKDEAQAG